MTRKALRPAGTVLVAIAFVAAALLVGPRILPRPPEQDGIAGASPTETLTQAASPATTSAATDLPPTDPSPPTPSPFETACFDPSAPAGPVLYTNPEGPAGPEPPEGYRFIEAARSLPTFAGVWVNEFRRQVHIAVTCDVEGAIAAIGHLFPRDRTVFLHLVEHTYAELQAIVDHMFADSDALMAEDIYLSYGSVDEVGNRVEIGIDPLNEVIADEMRRRYGEPIEFIYEPRPMPVPSEWPTAPEVLVAVTEPVDGERMVTCGGRAFPASILDDADAEDVPPDMTDDVRAAARFWHLEFPGLEALAWRVVHRDDTSAMFLAREGDGWTYLTLERDEHGWSPSGVGGCQPSGVLDGFGPAQWWLNPDYSAPGPASTELQILVMEEACASGLPAFGRMSSPVVTYAPDALTLTVGVREGGGHATCPSNPPTPAKVILPEPLGERVLLDGGRYPPAPPTPDF